MTHNSHNVSLLESQKVDSTVVRCIDWSVAEWRPRDSYSSTVSARPSEFLIVCPSDVLGRALRLAILTLSAFTLDDSFVDVLSELTLDAFYPEVSSVLWGWL